MTLNESMRVRKIDEKEALGLKKLYTYYLYKRKQL